jgi:hypothetical protein
VKVQYSGHLFRIKLSTESGVQRVSIIQRSRNLGQFSLTSRILLFKVRISSGHICQETVKQVCSAIKQISQIAKEETKGTNQHLPFPSQILAAEAALDSNALETKPLLGQRCLAISTGQPSHPPMLDIKNR